MTVSEREPEDEVELIFCSLIKHLDLSPAPTDEIGMQSRAEMKAKASFGGYSRCLVLTERSSKRSWKRSRQRLQTWKRSWRKKVKPPGQKSLKRTTRLSITMP